MSEEDLAVLPMRYLPDQILRSKTVNVLLRDLKTPAVQQFIEEMVASMRFYLGIGIAANQVGLQHRICIIQTPDDQEPRVLVNPRITRRDGQRRVVEGCLSLPGYEGRILRSARVWATAWDQAGKKVGFEGVTDLLAQALEHEIDHLDGVVYIDHLRVSDDLYPLEQAEEGKEGKQ